MWLLPERILARSLNLSIGKVFNAPSRDGAYGLQVFVKG